MSAPFVKSMRGGLRVLSVLVLLAAMLAACSSSGPRPERVRMPELETLEEPSTGRAERTERRRRRDREAEAPIDEAVVIEIPERATSGHQRALAAMEAGDWIEAEFELEQLILEFDQFPGPFVNLAIVYQQDGRLDEAREALEIAIDLKSDHVEAHNRLGMLLRELGEFDAAEAAYRRAIEIDPSYATAYYNLGVLLDLYLRREGEALELYERYQELLPEPDVTVGRWIIDLRRRLGVPDDAPRVAQEGGA